MPLGESLPPAEQDPLQDLLNRHGNTVLRNPHYGRPGHENDPELMTVSQAQDEDNGCPPLIDALLRVGDREEQERIIDSYRPQK
jgi:hypothetical protein